MTTNATITFRLSAALKEALLVSASIKGVSLSTYLVDLVATHVEEKGLMQRSESGQLVRNSRFVVEQVLDDLVAEHQRYVANGMDPSKARATIDASIVAYRRQQGVILSDEDIEVLDSRLT